VNKRDLIKAAKKGYPNTEDMVNAMLLAMNIAFLKKEVINIRSFGKFWPYKHRVKRVFNFKTNEYHDFDGSYTIKFRPCAEVKRRLNE